MALFVLLIVLAAGPAARAARADGRAAGRLTPATAAPPPG